MASLAFIETVSDREKFKPFDTPIPLFLGVCGDSYYYYTSLQHCAFKELS